MLAVTVLGLTRSCVPASSQSWRAGKKGGVVGQIHSPLPFLNQNMSIASLLQLDAVFSHMQRSGSVAQLDRATVS